MIADYALQHKANIIDQVQFLSIPHQKAMYNMSNIFLMSREEEKFTRDTVANAQNLDYSRTYPPGI